MSNAAVEAIHSPQPVQMGSVEPEPRANPEIIGEEIDTSQGAGVAASYASAFGVIGLYTVYRVDGGHAVEKILGPPAVEPVTRGAVVDLKA